MGLLLPVPETNPPSGGRLALVHETDPEAAVAAVRWAERHGAETCWEVTPGAHPPEVLEAVFDITAGRLAHVRLLGAGPESQASEATGAHPLWRAFALNGYTGTVALAPSAEADLATWRRWLFETRGWGCNTAAEKATRHSFPSH